MSAFLSVRIDEKRYGEDQILQRLRLDVRQGEIVSLIGASGCGKSTLLSIIAGLDPHYQGKIQLAGKDITGTSKEIGFIFQEPRLFPWLSVAENIAFDFTQSGDHEAAVQQLLKEVGLGSYGKALPKQLSGGQAQRVAIARGLFSRPRLLLLDEPFSAVDAFTRMKLQDLLVRIAKEHALTVVMVTHDIDEALYLSDRIVLLDHRAGPVRATFALSLPWPRNRAEATLSPVKAEILECLHAAHTF
ncbi:ABC transporter ATP-binding protein [Undibacterium sp. Rencai35W]|uniref:ABC transporter ATP-binding protein n=1 Tax=Undibacterium sp. Rencai35W TaxID=3413046 RepID=UPI003BF3E9BB